MKKITLHLLVFVSFFLNFSNLAYATSQITCGLDWAAIPPITKRVQFDAEGFAIELGFSEPYGGIATNFLIADDKQPGQPIEIIESRSGAGAAWQSTLLEEWGDENSSLTNQSAGNAPHFQWGYSVDYKEIPTVFPRYLGSENHKTLVALEYSPTIPDVENGKGINPCASAFDYNKLGKPSISISNVPNTQQKVIEIVSTYESKAIKNLPLKLRIPWQGLYLDREVARQSNARIYIVGPNETAGPYPIYKDIDKTTYPFESHEHPEGLSFFIPIESKYVVFVYTIQNEEYAIVIDNRKYGGHFRLGKVGYCSDPDDYNCGSFALYSNETMEQNVTYEEGSSQFYSYKYLIGKVADIQALGYQF